MDSSNKLSYVLGSGTVRLQELEPDDVWKLYEEMLKKMRGVMKYLPGFVPLWQLMNKLTPEGELTTDLTVCNFPGAISEKTKVCTVRKLEARSQGPVYIDKTLLLTDNALLLVWTADYDAVFCSGQGSQTKMTATRVDFRVVEKSAWDGYVSQSPESKKSWKEHLVRAMWTLCNAAQTGIIERKKRLNNIQTVHEEVGQVLRRISL